LPRKKERGGGHTWEPRELMPERVVVTISPTWIGVPKTGTGNHTHRKKKDWCNKGTSMIDLLRPGGTEKKGARGGVFRDGGGGKK